LFLRGAKKKTVICCCFGLVPDFATVIYRGFAGCGTTCVVAGAGAMRQKTVIYRGFVREPEHIRDWVCSFFREKVGFCQVGPRRQQVRTVIYRGFPAHQQGGQARGQAAYYNGLTRLGQNTGGLHRPAAAGDKHA
jgi:hypothetical protein